jgi:glycerol kinase
MQARHILAIDQGTTGSTALIVSTEGQTLGRANREFAQHFPKPGWVEHEPAEIWQSVLDSVEEALKVAGLPARAIAAIGITNQRETTLLWDRRSDQAVHRAIVWQDRRTSERCAALKKAGHERAVREATGLVLDPYFSGTKLAWLLDENREFRARAERGELAFGTIDSFLIWRLAGGAAHQAPHVTDVTNASRTLLMDLQKRAWHPGMCELLAVPSKVLPQIVPSAGAIAKTRGVRGLPDGIPITGVAGDQHAALFGQACFAPGEAKCTLGWQIGDEVVYALEGSVFIAGAAVQWLRDGLGLVGSAAEIEALARQVPSSEGVVFVPALSGLGAPYWDPDARGTISGITRGTTRAHLARATLEAIAFQVNDLVSAMSEDLGKGVSRMRVDGGAAANDLLMQLQSDLSAVTVERPVELESTARGAAMLAGIGAGLFSSGQAAAQMIRFDRTFSVGMSEDQRQTALSRWQDAVNRTKSSQGQPR